MLVIDDSNMRLLKMKERLLQVSNGADKVSLDDYRKLAKAIDNQVYNKLIDKIKRHKTHSYSLEEQLVFLDDILNDYDDLYELRCSFEFVNSRYSADKLELSDLSNILIDNIRNRKSIVEGYLVNNKNIENTKKELEKLNFQLIQEENKKDETERRIRQLENELKNNVLNAEGRIYSDIGSLKYTSIVQEFRDNSLELKELLENKELLEEEFNKINAMEVESSEKLKAAQSCYKNMPNGETLAVYHEIEVEAAKVKYKLVLLRIAMLISEEVNNYVEAIKKRMEIGSLNSVRIDCLRKLGIRLSIDSFSRIRLTEQLNIIKSLGDNSNQIALIRRNIDNYNTLIEERMRQNNEYMLTINDKVDFIKDDTSFTNIAYDSDIELPRPVVSLEDYNYKNKVIKISDVRDEFMLNRANQKSSGVVNRVNQVYNGVPVQTNIEIANQELVIVPSEEHEEVMFNYFDANDQTIDVMDDVFPTIGEDSEIFEQPKRNNDTMFTDTVPFESAPLFSDRYEDNIFGSKDNSVVELNQPVVTTEPVQNNIIQLNTQEVPVNNEPSMPEVFWPTHEETLPSTGNGGNVVSFDEQINALINEEPKVKRKVS